MLPGNSTELPQNLLNYLRTYRTTTEFTELPQNFTELPGFLVVQICVLPGPRKCTKTKEERGRSAMQPGDGLMGAEGSKSTTSEQG